ncbi:TetR/AcrR family transcriptional regulator [Mycolicibacter minnesotensis]
MTPDPQAARARANWPVQDSALLSAAGTKLNSRGRQTRAHLLEVAIEVLAGGGTEPISANRIAKQAGVSWGTVQHQFGDLDGLWVAVVTEIHTRSWTPGRGPGPDLTGSPEQRIETAIDVVWNYLETREGRALTALRHWLGPRRADVLAEYPRTAAALAAREQDWIEGFGYLMDGLDLDPDKLQDVRRLLPAAVRGLSGEQEFGFSTELGVARRTLARALAAYLS